MSLKHRAVDLAERYPFLWRLYCWRYGHIWDSQRPGGPVHLRDFCWRCETIKRPS